MQTRSRGIGLTKTLKDIRKKSGLDSDTGIRHADFGMMAHSRKFDENASIIGRKFDGIRQQIPHDLLEAVRIP